MRIRFLCISFLLFCSLIPLTTADNSNITSWTWSHTISPQKNYLWNVTQFSINDQGISEPDDPKFPIVEGSIITVTPKMEVYGIDYFDVISDNKTELPFTLVVDGIEIDDRGNLATEFIYPNLVVWENGTESNLFLLDRPEFRDQLKFPSDSEITGDLYIFTLADYYSTHLIARHIPTGLLVSWFYSFKNGIIHYEYLGSETIENETQQFIPYTYWWIVFLILMPLFALWKFSSKKFS